MFLSFLTKFPAFREIPFCKNQKALLLLFCTAASTQVLFAQSTALDSLESLYASESSDGRRLELLEEMTDIAFTTDLEQALIYSGRGVALAKKAGDKIMLPEFYEMHGRMYANLMELDSASLYFEKAMTGYKTIDNKKGEATTSFKIAFVAKRRGNTEAAMQADLYGLKCMEELKDYEGIASAYGRVSDDLSQQGRPDEALKYALDAIRICKENDLENELFFAYISAGDSYMDARNFEESLTYYEKSRDQGMKLNMDVISMAQVANNLGNALKKLGRYQEAAVDYQECLKAAKEANFPGGIAASTANLSDVNFLLGDTTEGLRYLLEGIAMLDANEDIYSLEANYRQAASIYGAMGDFKSAFEYSQKSRVLRDSLFNENSDEAISELRTQYEADKKEATIAAQNIQLNQRSKIQWLTGGVAVLLAVFLFFLFRSYRIRSRNNALLKAKNAENELLLKEIHHRVKNNLEVVSSLLELQSAQIDDQGIKDAMQEGQNRVQSIGIVHQKLYLGKNLGAIEMKDYFLNLSESILDSFGADDRVTIDCAMENLDVDIDTAVPLGLIVNELLTNTLKYAFPDGRTGKVRIHLEKDAEGSLLLEVADDGIGKSEITKGTGFGTQLISLLTTQLRGTMREEIANGTRVFFSFKMSNVHG